LSRWKKNSAPGKHPDFGEKLKSRSSKEKMMTTLSRLMLALVLCSLLVVGCQPASATPTPPPATSTPTASVTATQPLGDNGSGLIAFLSDQDGKPAIYLMNADGSNQRRLVGAKPRGACRAPVWSPDGQRIAYLIIPNGERDLHGPLEVWSVGLDGAAPIELSAGVTDTLLAYPSIDPIWSPDGTRLAVAALHPVAGTSDKRSVVTILRSDGSGVEQAFPLDWIAGGVEWSPNGEQILIQDRSPDESIWAHNAHVLSLSNGEIREVSRDLLSAAWSPDGTEIVVAPAQSEQVLIVKLDGTSRPIGPLPAGTTPELAVWSPDGATITVFGTTNNREEAGLYLVTLSTGQVRRVALVAESLDNLEYSPDGKQLLVSATHPGSSSRSTRWLNRSLLVYDLASATLTALTDGKGYDTHASWAPTTTAGAGRVALAAANVMQIEALATLAGHKDSVTGLVFLPDAAHLASLSGDLVLSLWDIKSGEKVNTLTEPGARVYNVAFSPNGNQLAVGNPDNTIGVWDVKNGQLLQTLSKRKSFVMKVAFSPDGFLLATGGAEGEITVWDVKSGQALYTLQAPNSPIGSLAFSPNGALLASGNAEGNTFPSASRATRKMRSTASISCTSFKPFSKAGQASGEWVLNASTRICAAC
jgi:WD40 repeat protein